jgi:Flp pilus assembly pilin Flp
MQVVDLLRSGFGWSRRGDTGAAMVEYVLLAAGIAVVVGGAAALFGGRLLAVYGTFFP